MNCRQCEGIEKFFGRKEAERRLRRYRKKGPPKTTQLLIEAIRSYGVEGQTLLDIGGGVGTISHELLSSGLVYAMDVDASSGYLEAAQTEARHRGTLDRIGFRHGDFVDLAGTIEAADVVTLDRVICCYHDMRSLVELSLARARKLYGLVYPRDGWWTKLAAVVGNFLLRVT